MEYYNSYNPYELTHWGIKGMKWGVRRYQNKDGSLTLEGGKRYNGADYKPRKSVSEKVSDYKTASKKKAAVEKAQKTKAAKKEAEEKAKAAAEQRKKDVESGKIRAKDMTQEELNSRIDRMNLEKRYQELRGETDPSSKTVNEAKTFAKKMWDNAIVPAATEAGKEIVKKAILDAAKKKTGTDVKEFDIDDFWKNRNKKTTQEMMDVSRRLTAEDQIKKKMQERQSEANTSKTKTETTKEAEPKTKTTDEKSKTSSADRTDTEPRTETEQSKESDTVKSTVTALSTIKTNSKEYSDNVDQGRNAIYDILDEDGNIIVRFNKDDKNK